MGNGVSFESGKCKVLLKQANTRMRILSNKLTNQTKVQRREIAELLDKTKIESAHVKVEHIIRDDYYIEVYEILQLYIGLVLARIPLLKAPKNLEKGQAPPPPQHEIREAICTLLYASGCLEVEELREFGKQMSACYGMDFVKECLENRSEFVSYKVVCKLTFQSPDQSIVQGYLEIIAGQYNVEYTAPVKVNEPLSQFSGPDIDKGSGTQLFPTFDAPGGGAPTFGGPGQLGGAPLPPAFSMPHGDGGMPAPPGAWGAPSAPAVGYTPPGYPDAPGPPPGGPPPGGPPPPGGGDYAYNDPFMGLPAVPGAPVDGTQFRRTSSAERIKAHRDAPGPTPGNPDAPYGGMPSFPLPPAGGFHPTPQAPSYGPAEGMAPCAPGPSPPTSSPPAPPPAPADFDALFPSVPGGLPSGPPQAGHQSFAFPPTVPSNPAGGFPPPAASAFPPPAVSAFPPPAAAPAVPAAPSDDFSFDLPAVPGGPPGQQPPPGGPPGGPRPPAGGGGDDAEDLMARFAALRRGGT